MLEQNWKSLIHFSASADNHFDPHKYSKLYGAAAAAAALGIGGGGGIVRRGWIRQASSGSIIFSPGLSKMTKRLRLKEGEVSHTEVKNLKYPAIPMKCVSMICLFQLYPSIKHSLKVSRSRNKIVEPQILPKKEQRNYSDTDSGWALNHLEFGAPVTPLTTRGVGRRLCPLHYYLPTRIWKPNNISALSTVFLSIWQGSLIKMSKIKLQQLQKKVQIIQNVLSTW